MNSGSEYRRALIASQFHRARRRAAVESLLSRLSGQPADLLSFDEIVSKLGIRGQSNIGVQQIPIDRIIGSVGRYQDFTRTFLPLRESDQERWVSVGAAARTVADLPPIEVYKVGETYFVLDGNHRVSLARQQGISYIDASVTEVRTRAPLPDGMNPERLIAAAEHGAFLQLTRLDLARPDVDIQVSVPGQYRHIESHIEAYRFIIEANEEREVAYEEAVTRWYDDVYLPMVHAIREQGILRYFPGRTETDFFVWLAQHRSRLQNELGVTITPDVAVARLLTKVQGVRNGRSRAFSSRIRRLARLTPPEPAGQAPYLTWAQERTLDRYSSNLFAAVLFPFVVHHPGGQPRAALERALDIAELEGARFCALCILHKREPTPGEAAVINETRLLLEARSCPTELLAIESSDAMRRTENIAFLNDLIIVERTFGEQVLGEPALPVSIPNLINMIHRPILILGKPDDSIIPQRVLVVHDTNHPLDEAIFIAAYLAERWGVQLSVLPISNGRNTEEIVERIDQYLALHEVRASFLEPVRPNDQAVACVVEAATDGDFDLMVMTGPRHGRPPNRSDLMTGMIHTVLQQWPRSLLVAT